MKKIFFLFPVCILLLASCSEALVEEIEPTTQDLLEPADSSAFYTQQERKAPRPADSPLPTIWERVSQQCNEYTRPGYNPNCEEIQTDSSIFINFFPTIGKRWELKFYGYGGLSPIQGFFRGWGVDGRGGTCHFTVPVECYSTVVGELTEIDTATGIAALTARTVYKFPGCPGES